MLSCAVRVGVFPVILCLVLLAAACGAGDRGATSTIDPAGLKPLDPNAVRQGQQLYAANCASCHGANGAGVADWQKAGPDGAFPPPPHDSTGHTWHHADGLLFRIIQQGCRLYQTGTTPCNMPAFGGVLDDVEIRAVIEFMKTWWGPREREFQAAVTENEAMP